MITSATQSGVQDGHEPTAEEVASNPRIAAMDRISADNDNKIQEEHRQAETGDDDDGDQLQAQLQQEAPTVLTDGLDNVRVKVKIDGVETEVSVADLQRGYQKNGAADKRLDEATRILREAQDAAAKLKAPPVGNDIKGDESNSPVASPDTKASKVSPRDLYLALVDGDEAAAVAGLEKLMQGGRPDGSTPTPEQLAAQVTTAVKQQMTNESALEQFGKDFSDITADPYLATVADGFFSEAMNEGKSFTEALTTSGQKTRDWLAAKAPKTEQTLPPTTTRAEKLERKKVADTVTGAQGRAASGEDPVQAPSTVIDEMRKQRGLN